MGFHIPKKDEYCKLIQCKYSKIKMQTLMPQKNYVVIRL